MSPDEPDPKKERLLGVANSRGADTGIIGGGGVESRAEASSPPPAGLAGGSGMWTAANTGTAQMPSPDHPGTVDPAAIAAAGDDRDSTDANNAPTSYFDGCCGVMCDSSTGTLCERLRGSARGGIGSTCEALAWGAAETHHMMFSVVCRSYLFLTKCDPYYTHDAAAPAVAGDHVTADRLAAMEQQVKAASVIDATVPRALSKRWAKYTVLVVCNPFYWFAFAMTVPLMVVGRWFHYLFNQHTKVRQNESEHEFEARVFWIYITDGGFILALLYAFCLDLLYGLIMVHDASARATYILQFAVDVGVYCAYIAGNVAFLQAMKGQTGLVVKACIASNASFAVLLSVLLVFSILRSQPGRPNSPENHGTVHWTLKWLVHWLFCAAVVIFILMSAFVYGNLWRRYDTKKYTHQSSRKHWYSCSTGCMRSIGIVFVAFTLILTLLIVAASVDLDSLWDAIA